METANFQAHFIFWGSNHEDENHNNEKGQGGYFRMKDACDGLEKPAKKPTRKRKSRVKREPKKKRDIGPIVAIDPKKGGLPYMAIQFQIHDTRKMLSVKKQVTFSEYLLLQDIEAGTIGARNAKKMICSKAEFFIEDLSSGLGYKSVNKIYVILKSLEEKKLILREKTRSKGREVLGLNPAIFGQILIDTHHEVEKKRHLKIVVNNSQNDVDNSKKEHTNHNENTHESCVVDTQSVCESPTNRVLSEVQPIEMTGEKPLLDSSRPILDSLRRGRFFKSSRSIGNGEMTEEEQAERIRFLKRQAAEIAQQEAAAK